MIPNLIIVSGESQVQIGESMCAGIKCNLEAVRLVDRVSFEFAGKNLEVHYIDNS